jgi:YVTN family beta-propeller protein
MKTRLLFALFCALAPSLAAQTNYKFLKEIPISDGRWDYLSIDPQARRLYVTHENNIIVLNLDDDKIVGEIADTPHVHGFAIAPDLGVGFSSNGGEAKASVVDLKTLKTITKVPTGENPDAILYEPGRKEVYTFNGRGKSATVFDAKTYQVVATIPLGGKPEFAVADTKAGRVFCNIEDTSELVTLDTATHKVAARWSLAPAEEPSGLAIDRENHRLFPGCRAAMLMVDENSGKVITSVPIAPGVDACEFEDATHLAFASCGSGTITIAKEEGPAKLAVAQTLETKRGARTMTLDPKTHRIYSITQDYKEDAAVSPGASPAKRIPIPGTCRVLVYGPG